MNTFRLIGGIILLVAAILIFLWVDTSPAVSIAVLLAGVAFVATSSKRAR